MRKRNIPGIIGILLYALSLTVPAAGVQAALPPGLAEELRRGACDIPNLLSVVHSFELQSRRKPVSCLLLD